MRRKIILKNILVVILLFIASECFSAEGILTSSGSSSQALLQRPKIKTIEEDVQDIVFGSLRDSIEKTLNFFIEKQNIEFMPGMDSYVFQQALMEAAQRPSTLEVIKEAYKTCLTHAYEMRDQKVLKAAIQDNVRREAPGLLQKIFQDPVFQVVLESSLKQGISKQQQLMASAAAGRQAQINAILRQQQMISQQVMAQTYQHMLGQYAAKTQAQMQYMDKAYQQQMYKQDALRQQQLRSSQNAMQQTYQQQLNMMANQMGQQVEQMNLQYQQQQQLYQQQMQGQ